MGADHPGCKIVTHPLSLFALSTAREMSFCVCETSPTTINTHREHDVPLHANTSAGLAGKETCRKKAEGDQKFSVTSSFMSLQGAGALI